jgi:hypothetical protein
MLSKPNVADPKSLTEKLARIYWRGLPVGLVFSSTSNEWLDLSGLSSQLKTYLFV